MPGGQRQGTPGQAPAAAPAARKFRSGAQIHEERTQTLTAVPSATTTTPFNVDLPAYGFLRGLWLLVDVTGGAGGGTAAVYQQDAPFSWIQTLQFLDVNSTPIDFQITGFDLAMIVKYGGYHAQGDVRQAFGFTQGGTGGNSSFKLRIPFELRKRDGLGSLPNKNNATAYKLLLTVAATTDVFSTAPAPTLPTLITIRVVMDAWWEPEARDLKGRPQAQEPPGNNTTQYWSKLAIQHATGAVTHKLTRVGYLIRNLVMIQRNAANTARAENIFPNPVTVIYEGQNKTIVDSDLIKQKMVQDFNYGVGALDAVGGLDTGVYVFNFNDDFGLQAGAELSRGYLPTTAATRLELQGNAGAAGVLSILTNDVAARDETEIEAG
jgi:hypothetical protein